ncbi:hypothetical protein ACFYOK_37645 [Microbispora bryophytorum]|uniref:hypothetical protein n=1 Tax=Microbispora bryophytorum TaxID=1460882 RepID=UPI0033CF158D
MGYAQQDGKYFRAFYTDATGRVRSSRFDNEGQRFPTKTKAENWADEQEADIRRKKWKDPRDSGTLFKEWFGRWWPAQDLSLGTRTDYYYLADTYLLPEWGDWPLSDITASEINAWEQRLIKAGYARTGVPVRARTLLCTILGDAVLEGLIDNNPALRQRKRGRRTGAGTAGRRAEKVWASPLDALLFAERTAILAGRDDEFIEMIAMAYTGMRDAEVRGLQPAYVRMSTVRIDWQMVEHGAHFYLQPPKDDSHRSIDLPPFLADLLSRQLQAHPDRRCCCKGVRIEGQTEDEQPCPGGLRFVFLGPGSPKGPDKTLIYGHVRNSNFARRYVDPAADGWYPEEKARSRPTRSARPVMVDLGRDGCDWPGRIWRPPWGVLPTGKDLTSAWCTVCGSEQPTQDGIIVRHKAGARTCRGSGATTDVWDVPFFPPRGRGIRVYDPDDEEVCVATWLPIMKGLTPHGLRHGHKTWMAELAVPEILQAERMGHAVPGMRGVYTHVSEGMRADLKTGLQRLWEESLAMRAGYSSHSPVAVLDALLKPYRDGKKKTIYRIPTGRSSSPIQMISG